MNNATNLPTPEPTPTSLPFWQGLTDNKVMLQQCGACSTWIYYPRSHCPACLSDDLKWQEVTGEGAIYSYTIARRPTAPQFAGLEPQFIAVVELREGVRVNTVIVHASEAQLKVGLAVKPYFNHGPREFALLYFEPA